MYSNTRFEEIIKQIPFALLEKSVEAESADKYCKHFNTRNHLLTLIYAQLSQSQSLREVETGFNCASQCHYHLNLQPIKRTTLADANERRNPAPFKAIAEYLMSKLKPKEAKELTYLLDSSPIQLKGYGFDWTKHNHRIHGLKMHVMIDQTQRSPTYFHLTDANVTDNRDAQRIKLESGATYVFDKGYNDYNWWYQIHEAKSIFVTRFKVNAAVKVSSSRATAEQILADEEVEFKHKSNRYRHTNHYHGTALRRITVAREGKKPLIIATNDMTGDAVEIAEKYRQRWQIELFFKWIKQRLKVKKFIGRSKNAVILQLYAAIITYMLVKLYQQKSSQTKQCTYLFLIKLKQTLFNRIKTEEARTKQKEAREQQKEHENCQYQMF